MTTHRHSLTVIALLALVTAGTLPALGQDLDFAAVPRVTLGLTNQGPVGGLCASGLLNFSKTTGPGTVTGTLVSGSDVRCDDATPVPIANGSLTLFTANRSVVGTLGDEILFGQALPNGHGLIAVDTFGPDSVVGIGTGLTVLIERHGTTFTQSNLTGTWRIKGLTGEQFPEGPGGSTESFFGSITFFANRSATGTLTFLSGGSASIIGGNVSMAPGGQLTGVISTVRGEVPTAIDVTALMAPDKNFIAGVIASDRSEQGMVFLQREPTGTPYTQSDLAGTWSVFSLQGVTDDSSDGTWFKGTVSFDSAGHVIASNLVNSSGVTFPGVTGSLFTVSPQGFIGGSAEFDDGTLFLEAQATMFKEKNQIIGVDSFGDDSGFATVGLFTMFKTAPPPPASVVQFSTGNYSVQEGRPATITVTRSGATTTAVTVDYLASDPVADTTLASGTLTFPAGTTSRTFSVPTIGNVLVDGDHVATLRLTNPTNGATLGARSTANLNILNDDSTFAFSQGTFTVSEKTGKASITVMRSGGLGFPTSVPFSATPGTAVAGQDFVPVSGNLSFPKNVATAKFDVSVKNNTVLDGNRSVVLQLFPPIAAGRPGLTPADAPLVPTATLIITDDDTPGVVKLSGATYSGGEGKTVTITILRAPAVAGAPLGGNVSVGYTTSNNGSAVAGLDYTATAGAVTFVGTQTTQTVTIPLTKDSLAEGPEYFLFSLGGPTNGVTLGSPSVARVNINDIDKGGLVSLSATKYSVTEGAGNVSITVRRSGATPSNASVVFATLNGTAAAGTDYGNVSTTLTFAANETKTVVVPIFQNGLPDGDRTFTVALGSPQGTALGTPASAVVTIVDDESSIQFAQASFDAKEGTPGKIVVVRGGARVSQTLVSYNISSITAQPGVDFSGPVTGTLTFKPNDTQQSLTIPTIPNSRVDGNRSVLLTLSAPTGGALLGLRSTATFTIVDDDQPGRFQVGSPTYTVKEGGSVVVDIVRLPAPGVGGPLGGNISISYATSPGNASAGSDFTHVAGTLVFGPLETRKSITVRTLQDTLAEPAENFFFTLGAPTGGASLGSPSSATILIQDDDSAGVVFLGQSLYKVAEGAGNISITVLRSGGTANASVHFTTVAGTATDSDRAPLGRGQLAPGNAGVEDYGFVSTTLVFGAGEMKKTVVIPIFQDDAAEGDEVFTVVLSNPLGGLKLGTPSSAPVTIVDDEVVIQFANRFQNNQPVVVRTGSLSANVSVQYVATSGTALLGDDFLLPPGTLVFPPGVSVRTVPITTINDNIAEGPETFTITLMNPTPPAQLGPNFMQVFTLDDNDFGGVLNFANTSPTAVLGQSKPMTVTRSGGAGTVMTVGWAAIGGTAVPDSDFSPAAGQVTFLANQSAQTFFVDVSAAPTAAGKTIVFGLMPPGPDADPVSSKLGPANTSTLTILGPPVTVVPGALELVSRATDGTRGNGDSARPVTSSDGRFVAFISAANNLAAGAGAGAGVYLRDREADSTELISVGQGGPENGSASAVAINGDGRYVAFVSTSSNLVSGDGNGVADVFVRDRDGNSTQRVSMPAGGGDADGASIDVAISADGRFVAFTSLATNLAAGAGNTSNLYVFDRTTGTTALVGVEAPPPPAPASFPPLAGGRSPALSADGGVVAFVANDLMAPGLQAYVFDRTMGSLELVSQNDGAPANGAVVAAPAITADGRLVVFESDATNLGAATGGHQVYVHDRTTGGVELVSQPLGGPAGNAPSTGPSFSADGRFVTFVSAATNLVAGDTNGQADVFVHDRATGLNRRVNVLNTGTQADGTTDTAVMSAAGTFVTFATAAMSLTGGDLNNAFDVLGVPVTIPPLPTADIAIANVVDIATPALDASVTFTVTATNLGPAAATSVEVTDRLPAGYALLSATPSQGAYTSGTGVWNVGSLAANASATLSLTATVLAGGPYVTVATRTASSSSDPNPANDSATASVTPQALTLTTDGSLVGIGRTIGGTVTIPSPAPAGFSVTFNTSPAGIVSVPPIVAFATGATTAPFTVTGVAVGTATITGSAAGLASGNASVTATNSVISLGTLANLGPGQSLSLPINLSVPAPAGGVTVNFASANTSVATVTSSVVIPGGQLVPAANPQVTGVGVGSTGITASATGFAPDTRTANVVVNVTFSPSPFSVVAGTGKNITVTISAPAPAGGFTFNLVTANTSVATVASPVTVLAGQTSVQAAVTGVTIASTTLQATGTGVTSATVTVNVTAPPPISIPSQSVGKDLQQVASVSLGSNPAPAGGLTVTVTSADPTRVRVSASQTAAGNGSVTLNIGAGGFFVNYYVQALDNTGTVGLTASAPGYQDGSATITLTPSAFIINGPGNFSTTTLSANTSIQIASARLNPATLAPSTTQEVRAGATVDVAVTATGSGVGSITASPLTFSGGSINISTAFHPLAAGTSLIQVVTPAGFNTSVTSTAITATVSAPKITLGNQTIGKDLQINTFLTLEAPAPAGGVQVTLTSLDPSNVVLAPNQTTAGNGSLIVNFAAGTSFSSFYTQALGNTSVVTVQATAPAFQNASATVTLAPSGFVISTPGNFATTTISANTSISIALARLNPGPLTVAAFQELRAGAGPVSVDVTATDLSGSGVGAISVSPLVFDGTDGVKSTSFHPMAAGTSQLQVATPAGFSTPAASGPTAIVATVNAPRIFPSNATVGKDLQQSVSFSLEAPAPPGGLPVTFTSLDPSKVVLAPDQTTAGNSSITVNVGAGLNGGSFYYQALGNTSAVTVQASAPAYQNASATVTLTPSGFILNGVGDFGTTTFSANTSFSVALVRLNPGSLTVADFQALRAGASPVSVDVTATDLSGSGVGTISVSPLVFNPTQGFKNTAFDPAAAGTSRIRIGTPPGFSTPATDQVLTVTVTAPTISLGISNVLVGKDLQVLLGISLAVAPPSPVTVTVNVASTAVAVLSKTQTAAGVGALTFTNVTGTFVGFMYVQGLASTETTTITTQAPGYTDNQTTVTAQPSGFILNTGSFTTTAGAANSIVQVASVRLDPTTLNSSQAQEVRGGATIMVPVTVSDPTVGTITTSPLTFPAGVSTVNTQFDPVAAGTSQITVGVPSGFATPSNFQQITVTVNP